MTKFYFFSCKSMNTLLFDTDLAIRDVKCLPFTQAVIRSASVNTTVAQLHAKTAALLTVHGPPSAALSILYLRHCLCGGAATNLRLASIIHRQFPLSELRAVRVAETENRSSQQAVWSALTPPSHLNSGGMLGQQPSGLAARS